MHDDDFDDRPLLEFIRLDPKAKKPEPTDCFDNAFVIFTPKRIYTIGRGEVVKTGIRLSMPKDYSIHLRPYPAAMHKGIIAMPPYPVAHLDNQELVIPIIRPWHEPPSLTRQLVLDIGDPFAIISIIRTPRCDMAFDGWDAPWQDAQWQREP